MPKKTDTPEGERPDETIARATRIEALKLRAAELPWDPDDLRLMLVDLLELL